MTNEVEPKDISTPGRIARALGVVAEPLKRHAPLMPTVKSAIASIRSHSTWFLVPIGLFIGAVWVWLLYEALSEVWFLTEGTPSGTEDQNRNRIQAIFFGVGVIGALLAALVVPYRLWMQSRQTKTAEDQRQIAEQGHITDRLNKAIEMLGTEKTKRYRVRSITYDLPTGDKTVAMETHQRPGEDPDPPIHSDAQNIEYGEYETSEETIPNLEVRLGAIYALERIAQDSERDHITVMEVLCAYIRENAPASMAKDHDLGEWPEWPEDANEETHKTRDAELEERARKHNEWANGLPSPRVDLQAALSVIGRRSDERVEYERRQRQSEDENDPGFQLDLSATCLQKADLRRAKLDRATMTGVRMEGAYFGKARMERAILIWARMDWTFLGGARMERAKLGGAQMERADLQQVRMEGANLMEARMERAILVEAQMEKVILHQVRMEGVDLLDVRLKGASLRSADFKSAKNLAQDTVNSAYGDASTKLPDGIEMPDHWDAETDPGFPDKKYKAWLDAGAPPGKPKGQGG